MNYIINMHFSSHIYKQFHLFNLHIFFQAFGEGTINNPLN